MKRSFQARPAEPNDDAIVARLFERDDTALDAVQSKYALLLSSFPARFLNDPRDREEAVNDALLRLWNSVPPDKPRSLGAYLTTLLRRSAIDRLRRMSRAKDCPAALTESLDELDEILPDRSSTEDAFLSRELGRSISAFLKELPARSREIFMRRYYGAGSVKEIASALGVSASTVEKELKKLRLQLKEKLEREGFEV